MHRRVRSDNRLTERVEQCAKGMAGRGIKERLQARVRVAGQLRRVPGSE